MTEFTKFTMDLPAMPPAQIDGEWIRVGDYVFLEEDLDDPLEREAEFIAACLVAQHFLKDKREASQGRLRKATDIVTRVASSRWLGTDHLTTCTAIAEAMLEAFDGGKL